MATVDKMMPFVIMFESGVVPAKGESTEALWQRARKSGFANDKDDAGGATMVGVTIGTYAQYRRLRGLPSPSVNQLRAMTYGEWRDILKTMYWDRWRADRIVSQGIAEILVDWVWASGKYGITIPQRVLGVTVDGVVGPKTLAAVNQQNPAQFFARIMAERKAYIDRICTSRPVNNKYKRGWLRRLNAITFQP